MVIASAVGGVPAASAEVTVTLQVAAEGLTAPLGMVSPPDGTKGKCCFGDWSRTFPVKDGRPYVATKGADGTWTMEDVKVADMPTFNSYVPAFGQDADGEISVMAADTTGPVGGLDRV